MLIWKSLFQVCAGALYCVFGLIQEEADSVLASGLPWQEIPSVLFQYEHLWKWTMDRATRLSMLNTDTTHILSQVRCLEWWHGQCSSHGCILWLNSPSLSPSKLTAESAFTFWLTFDVNTSTHCNCLCLCELNKRALPKQLSLNWHSEITSLSPSQGEGRDSPTSTWKKYLSIQWITAGEAAWAHKCQRKTKHRVCRVIQQLSTRTSSSIPSS